MERNPATIEEVREAQEHLKKGLNNHEQKNYKEAIEEFAKTASIRPFDPGHLEEFRKKLKSGSYKLEQESIAYMGCAAVHLNNLIQELDDEQREEVPVDQQLAEIFKEWE